MAIIKEIRKKIQQGKSVAEVKQFVRTTAPEYNVYWVEDEWVKHQFGSCHRGVGEVLREIRSNYQNFHHTWLKEDKLQNITNVRLVKYKLIEISIKTDEC